MKIAHFMLFVIAAAIIFAIHHHLGWTTRYYGTIVLFAAFGVALYHRISSQDGGRSKSVLHAESIS